MDAKQHMFPLQGHQGQEVMDHMAVCGMTVIKPSKMKDN